MEAQTDGPLHGQLISVPRKDTVRLLEVYVKRSLSLNDGTMGVTVGKRSEKWVTMSKKQRRRSSDPSVHLAEDPGLFSAEEPPTPPTPPPDHPAEEEKPPKKSRKSKKPSVWKSIIGFFSQKNEDKDEDDDVKTEESDGSPVATNCLPAPHVAMQKRTQRKKSLRRKLSKRLSTRSIKPLRDLSAADGSTSGEGEKAVFSVQPTYSYYEKVSEELEKIVHEVKEKEEVKTLSNDEVIERLIALTIEQGDAIDDKLKGNPTLSNFFQRLTYSSFQKLADAYLEKEAAPNQSPPTAPPTAPELVKLAFTLDFTARIAGLSKHNVGHITCLGNRYLQDRFTYKQVCTDHPWSDSEDVEVDGFTQK